ncbi:hypothetical protein Acr_17g0012400 [Actinidia rufa]|uniref:Uncharacterized protein n=1 Tax=Actinidia rufa TaxID=165716 RepID=A0A7J0G4I0_9ERIC|nr:hypothetical protein Acr_17g0012400 [Actinidia rufa]
MIQDESPAEQKGSPANQQKPFLNSHFEDFVAGHFRLRGHNILSACRAYMEGAEVGSADRERDPYAGGNNPIEFKAAVGRMMKSLVTNFIKNGSVDCEQFRTTA